ncbi:DegT/DnrJ/EryC1/StrS family aminotransferase [Pseudokordiimonas caeni]|uniref:DegT/DnrJ/EryC1/StrS family aminotransferase n=1 Tax=Pseudokordiimonas caeni TaxID=2997908 RepID=UPI002810B5C3|nr:DegT/DnrJ/EryC1/StrS family aminotransferase [Pseudokordiimonas caeni]
MEETFAKVADAISEYWEAHERPVFDPAVPHVALHHPTFGAEEITAFTRQMLSTQVTMGREVERFEEEFCQRLGYGHGVSNNSGSSANLLMMSAVTTPLFEARLMPGDEVILPALTWSTSLWPIIQRGLKPVFVDSDPVTMNMDPAAVEAAIGAKTRAVLAVPVYGNPCDMDAISAICRDKGLLLLEDCCESLGARYKGRPVGSDGLISTFSFYFSHHMTTLEGGICLAGDPEIADIMRILRAHGWTRQVKDREKWERAAPTYDPRFIFVGEGYNMRLTEPQAVMGQIQLKKLEGFVEARQRLARKLIAGLSGWMDILQPQKTTDGGEHSWFGMPILLNANAPITRDDLCAQLNAAGVETRPVIAGNLVRHPGTRQFDHRVADKLTGADAVMDRGFAIPCHQSLSDEAVDYMLEQFSRILGQQKGRLS